MDPKPASTPPNRTKFNLALDYRVVIFALLAVIVIMLLLWRPWQADTGANARTIKVTGETTLKAEPDEYAFYPTYEFREADKAGSIAAAEAKQKTVVGELKRLGVTDKQIKTDVDGYQDYTPIARPAVTPDSGDPKYVYTLRLTVTVGSREKAQEVQTYLTTTEPTGAVSPAPTFSESKRKELENKARDEATKQARAKADQSAKNLGFKVASVKSVDDGSGFGGISPGCGPGGLCSAELRAEDTSASLSVQPGEQDLSYSVTVTYFIR